MALFRLFFFFGFGILLFGIGGYLVWHSSSAGAAFDKDPVCHQQITIATAPDFGPSCTILRGKITGASKYEERGGPVEDIVRMNADSDGSEHSIEISDDQHSQVFADANEQPGGRAIVLTLGDDDIALATAAGTITDRLDPRSYVKTGAILMGGGSALLIVGILWRPKRKFRSEMLERVR